MPRQSAGLLLYRVVGEGVEVLLVHPGGPYWVNRDEGAWSLPKGEYDPGEDPLEVARREFREELGVDPPGQQAATFLGTCRQAGGKHVRAWALEGDVDVSEIRSNTFTMEWPPNSGRCVAFPEVDRAAWFDPPTARRKINQAQATFVDTLTAVLAGQPPPA